MDKAWQDRLAEDAARLGISLDSSQVELLARHVSLMLQWNAKLNLTRIIEPDEVLAKHVLDSLVGLRALKSEDRTFLDIGSGAGFPGVPWLIARAELSGTLVDAVAKKVNFLKQVLARLEIRRGRALHTTLTPEGSASPARVDVVTARALTHLAGLARLARAYLQPTGAVVALLGPGNEDPTKSLAASGFDVVGRWSIELPRGHGIRHIVRAVPRETPAP